MTGSGNREAKTASFSLLKQRLPNRRSAFLNGWLKLCGDADGSGLIQAIDNSSCLANCALTRELQSLKSSL